MNIRRILNDEFRRGPLYALREWNILSQREKELISGLHDERNVYGIFSPLAPQSKLTLKVAYHDLALVYLHLAASNLLPHHLTALHEDSLNNAIVRLVIDQILEVKWNGNFVSGVHATEAIFGSRLYGDRNFPNFISILSNQAIEYALHFDNAEMRMISNKLYTYHTTPWDSSAKRNFNKVKDIRDFVFSGSPGSLFSILNRDWALINDPAKDYWLGWNRKDFSGTSSSRADMTIYKLYISPLIEDLPKAMSISLPLLTSSNAFSFKVGNSIQGLLRPDKIVAYFDDKSSLLQVAEELKEKLKDCKAQGVPFTAQIDDDGILSWGADPPGYIVLEAIEGGSWRCKVTDQIALAITQAKSEKLEDDQAIDFIGSKLFLADIDVYDWAPLN
ncbi:MAG TPA: hypothetical protein VGI82_01480 [Chitinophagaceae bacterium]|jgi:hypothetical protein